MTEPIHCSNFDPSYEGCRECQGKVEVTQPDGTVDTLCRAGEAALRNLIASSEIPTSTNDLPVFKVRFPGPEGR